MTLYESLMQIKPNPEVEEAVYYLINLKDDGAIYFYDESLPEGERHSLHLYFFVEQNKKWWLELVAVILKKSNTDHAPSPCTLFRYSPFAPFFDDGFDYGEEVGAITFTGRLYNDVDAAIRLLTYYLRFCDFQGEVKDWMYIDDSNEFDYDYDG